MGRKASRKKKLQRPESWYPPQGWINLPAHLTENILQRLGPIEILETAQHVCATWRALCRNPGMWRVIDMTFYPYYDLGPRGLRHVFRTCYRAVDFSKGELIDINIDHLANDDLLLYISKRSSHLKRLRIENCNSVSGEVLARAVKRLPELEELHMSRYNYVSAEDIQKIGKRCPKLKSFTFKNERGYYGGGVDNRIALAIARNMPNLRRLGVSGHALSDGGVKAILGGCPRLQSIDLRDCFNLDSDKRLCFESIYDLRRLFYHSTARYWEEWDWDSDEEEDGDSEDEGFDDFFDFFHNEDGGYCKVLKEDIFS